MFPSSSIESVLCTLYANFDETHEDLHPTQRRNFLGRTARKHVKLAVGYNRCRLCSMHLPLCYFAKYKFIRTSVHISLCFNLYSCLASDPSLYTYCFSTCSTSM
jgi:hypothetical protein